MANPIKTSPEEDQKIMEMKYKGFLYKDIGVAVEKTEDYIESLFRTTGRLYIKYLEYEQEQNQIREQEARSILRRETSTATKAIMKVLKNALRRNDDEMVLKAAKEILDRGGVPAISKHQTEFEDKTPRRLTDNELNRHLRASGIDPNTGIPLRKAATQQN